MPPLLELIDPVELADFHHLTFPAVLKIARERPDSARAIAVKTTDDIAGLAVSLPGPNGQFELLSLYISPFFRRMGWGSSLLQAVEDDFHQLGYSIGVHFMNVERDDQAHVRFCMQAGWCAPVATKLVCRSTLALAFQTPWLVKAELPERYRIVDWSSLDQASRAAVKADVGRWIPHELDPFNHETGCDPSTSVALVDAANGNVLGFVMTHLLDGHTLRWTCSYLAPHLQSSGLMCALWLETARRQSRHDGVVDFCFTAAVSEPRMARFAFRRMKPWLSELSYGCTTTKNVA